MIAVQAGSPELHTGRLKFDRIRYTPYGQHRSHPRGDLNGDGVANSADSSLHTAARGKALGDPGYFVEADLNHDGVIDAKDAPPMSSGVPPHRLAAGSPLIVGYAGYLWEPATGLYLARHRWYNPDTGRWLNRDPISYLGGDNNLYAYVGGAPWAYTDPMGLRRFSGEIDIWNIDFSKPGAGFAATRHEKAREMAGKINSARKTAECMAGCLAQPENLPTDILEAALNNLVPSPPLPLYGAGLPLTLQFDLANQLEPMTVDFDPVGAVELGLVVIGLGAFNLDRQLYKAGYRYGEPRSSRGAGVRRFSSNAGLMAGRALGSLARRAPVVAAVSFGIEALAGAATSGIDCHTECANEGARECVSQARK